MIFKHKKTKKIILLALILLLFLYIFHPTWTPKIRGFENSIAFLGQVYLNGTHHEIMIRGTDKRNPVILFVHGGPACPETAYVQKYQDLLEKDFTIVHYDQRGSGKSYHFTEDYSDISIDVLVQDLLEITDYISSTLDTDEIILMGHSFGTGIGIRAANKAPEKYIAYIGIGQQGNYWDGDLEALEYCLSEAKKAGRLDDIKQIESYRLGVLNKTEEFPTSYVRKYKGAARKINEAADVTKGLLLQSEYSPFDGLRYLLGLLATGDKLWNDMLHDDLTDEIRDLQIPCYFVSGYYDYLTPPATAKRYLETLNAPYKAFVVFNESAHYPQFEEKEAFYKWMLGTYGHIKAP